ncbi:unnamed protein product [Adineta steineri]|uniref:Major facilitator superfamily (MFS) profile domain-containing protein n=1 Tax=Adineta steineri TaxID=433720 RepID=A0A813S8W9_9BILA|nr:unnamed protein product [Adineta steineri]CAF1205878.1 unnamed protein product [Adineta steineri]
MVPPIMVYTWSFTAATPDFRCRHPTQISDTYNNKSNELFSKFYQPTETECKLHQKLASLKECQRCYRKSYSSNRSTINNLQTCDNYVFDRSIYKKTLVEEWTMVCDRVGLRSTVQMIYFAGFMCGALFFGTMADRYGRRKVMGASFILMTFAGFLCTYGPQARFGVWPSYIIFVIARILLACSTRGISESGFVLGSEMVEPDKRLMVGIVMDYFFVFGEFFLVLMAYIFRTWRTLTLVITLFTIPFCFFYFILPESPRWLVSKGRFDEAETILRHIAIVNKQNFDSDAYEQLKETQKNSMTHKTVSIGVISLFRTKVIRIITLNLFFQWLAQNLVFYGVSQNTGAWELDPYLSFALSGVVELFAYIVIHLILNRLGRKLPYCLFAILFGLIALLTLPVQAFLSENKSMQRSVMLIINISLKFLASASFAIIYLYTTELFPTNVRTTALGYCSMIGRLGAILGTFSNDYLARVWINFPIILYGVISLIAGILALVFPETLHKPLPQTVDEVEQMGLTLCSRNERRRSSLSNNAVSHPTTIETL